MIMDVYLVVTAVFLPVLLRMVLITWFLILLATVGIQLVNILEVISRSMVEPRRLQANPALTAATPSTSVRKDKENRTISLAFAITKLGMMVLYYACKYDESGTASPTWSGMLGRGTPDTTGITRGRRICKSFLGRKQCLKNDHMVNL